MVKKALIACVLLAGCGVEEPPPVATPPAPSMPAGDYPDGSVLWLRVTRDFTFGAKDCGSAADGAWTYRSGGSLTSLDGRHALAYVPSLHEFVGTDASDPENNVITSAFLYQGRTFTARVVQSQAACASAWEGVVEVLSVPGE